MKKSVVFAVVGLFCFMIFAADTVVGKKALIGQSKCVKCGVCLKNCPVKAISKVESADKKVLYIIDPKKCVACGICIKNCPVKTIAYHQYADSTAVNAVSDSVKAIIASGIKAPVTPAKK